MIWRVAAPDCGTNSTRRVAALDCGTNSIRLLIAEGMPAAMSGRALREIDRQMRIVRLGEDVDRTGRLGGAALVRTESALLEYAATIRAAGGVAAVRLVATSAVRDAANRDDFLDVVLGVLGVPAQILDGATEAHLSFAGVVHDLTAADPGRTVVVVDIGGGSTEVVRGRRSPIGNGPGRVGLARSLDVGSVRLTERHISHDPPTPGETAAVETDVRRAWTAAGLTGVTATDLVGVAGTVTTLAAVALRLDRYDSARIHGCVLSAAEVGRAVAAVTTMSRDRREACPVIHPGRVDVIAAGGVILRTVMDLLGSGRIRVSEHDILDGVALDLLRSP